MTMLFFSADTSEVEQVSREFAHAGIPCEVRNSSGESATPPETEVWVQNDQDCSRANLLCVQLGMGFARRPIEELEPELECDY